MKKATLTCVLLAVSALGLNSLVDAQTRTTSALATGVAESVNIVLHDAQPSYVVPIGKVLVIEHLNWALESSANRQVINIKPSGDPSTVGDFQMSWAFDSIDWFAPDRPIRIVGDGAAGVSILTNSQVDWRDVLITGVLRDV